MKTVKTVKTRPSRQHLGPSVFDVAELAGVSAQTVSRVSNGKTNVSEPTRVRVLEAMSTLGYRPNRAARSLATGRFGTIGIITSTLSSYGTMRTLDAIADAARDNGYTLSLFTLSLPSPGDVAGAASTLADQNVDGIIVMVETAVLESRGVELPVGIPVVATDVHAGRRYLTVDSDEAIGIRAGLAHLVELGHRRIHHVAGPPNSYAAALRRDLWAQQCREAGMPLPNVLYGDWSAASGVSLGRVLSGQPDVTAVFCANDQMALGVMTAMQRAGRSVPADISVLGFDDMTEAEQFNPALTTIRQDFAALGHRALDQLITAIDGRGTDALPSILTQLVIRDSTGAAPRTGSALDAIPAETLA